jgi:hypothetical protein
MSKALPLHEKISMLRALGDRNKSLNAQMGAHEIGVVSIL